MHLTAKEEHHKKLNEVERCYATIASRFGIVKGVHGKLEHSGMYALNALQHLVCCALTALGWRHLKTQKNSSCPMPSIKYLGRFLSALCWCTATVVCDHTGNCIEELSNKKNPTPKLQQTPLHLLNLTKILGFAWN